MSVNDVRPVDDLARFTEQLEGQGLRAALQFLNNRTPHRFTGVFRFDEDMLRSVSLVDKWFSDVTQGTDIPLAQAYCAHLHATGEPLEVQDGLTDTRTPWMAGAGVRSYCGALIRDLEGNRWGAICHFDEKPCESTASSLPVLIGAASLIYPVAAA